MSSTFNASYSNEKKIHPRGEKKILFLIFHFYSHFTSKPTNKNIEKDFSCVKRKIFFHLAQEFQIDFMRFELRKVCDVEKCGKNGSRVLQGSTLFSP